MNTNASFRSIRGEVSAEEWQTRVDLAACYRLVDRYGMTDMIYNHITARVPGPEHHLLINLYGLTYREITASSLVKIDLDGEIIWKPETDYGINKSGYVIHGCIHRARKDVACVLHTHTSAGMAVSAMKCGLLPLTQTSIRFVGHLGYHDYEGPATDLDERERLVRDLGDTKQMLLRNHGTLALGATPGEAWSGIYQLESACSVQVRALAGGRDHVLIAPEAAQEEVRRQQQVRPTAAVAREGGKPHSQLVWEAVLRRVQRELPGYDS